MAIEARNRALPDWFTKIRTGEMVLPRFQRYEAWDYDNIIQLFNTILRDLPIGAVLVLEIGNEEPFISRPLQGAPKSAERVTEHLLDGQQRLTALWRGLNNNYEDRTYFIHIEPDEETGLPYYVTSVARSRREGEPERRPFWANDPGKTWERKFVPLDYCAPNLDSQQRFRTWLKEAIQNPDERDQLSDQITIIRQKFTSFNLPFLSLPASTKKETALDVFIKMNTSAAALTTFDIVVAQVEASMETSLHELVGKIREACPGITHYYSPEELVLYASALMQGKAPTNSNYMAKEFGRNLLDHWDVLVDGVKRTAAFLEEEKVYDATRLPSDVVLPVLAALWAQSPKGLDPEGRARVILRKYLWRAFFSNRYERTTSTRSLVDHAELLPWVTGKAAPLPAIFDSSKHPLPSPEELITAGWPKKKDRVARAILALCLRHGGLDLADGSGVSRLNLPKREYHHLFPDAHLQRMKVAEEKIYLSLNCALVTWNTNRRMSDKEPEKYLAERLDGTGVSESEVRARLESHLIPYEEMVAGDYEKFLKARARKVYEDMLRVCDAKPEPAPTEDSKWDSKAASA